jgi:hypothetical protein
VRPTGKHQQGRTPASKGESAHLAEPTQGMEPVAGHDGDPPAHPTAQPLRRAQLRQAQHSRGNQAVQRELGRRNRAAAVQRELDYTPQISSPPMIHLTLLNDVVEHSVAVRNARSAPQGSSFEWGLSDDLDTGKLEELPSQPARGPRAKVRARAKEVFDEQTITPELAVTTPEGIILDFASPVSIGVMPPTMSADPLVMHGGLGESHDRDMNRILVGDTLHMSLQFDNIVDARSAGIRMSTMMIGAPVPNAGDFDFGPITWEGPLTAGVSITARAAGRSHFTFSALVPGMEESLSETIALTAVADARHFKDRCNTAHANAEEAYARGEEYFYTCSQNYKTGYDAHKGALDAQNARDRLTNELIMGVLFAAIGGAAGGAIGGIIGHAAGKASTAVGAAALGAITDAAKDVGKYIGRIPTTLLARSGGGGGASTPADADRPSHGAGATGAGATGPAATDPFGWHLDVMRAFAAEKRQLFASLRNCNEVADQLLATGSSYEFDWDPVAVLANALRIDGTALTELGEPPSARDYEKCFWIAWLSQYAYKLGHTSDPDGYYTHYSPEENIGKDVREAIDRVAASFGENGGQWIREYGQDSYNRVDAEADEYNRR